MSVQCDLSGDIAILTINRPEALNALNSAVLDAIGAAVDSLPENTRGILVTGAGKAFVAGADIAEMAPYASAEAEEFSRRGQEAFGKLADFPGPVVAAINGFALGGGLELALACDLLFASNRAKLGLPETTLGVVPGFGGTQRLARRVGLGRAKKMMFSGQMVGAAEALDLGLVDDVFEPEELVDSSLAFLKTVAANGPLAVAECKRLADVGWDLPLEDGLAMEAAAFGAIFDTADRQEGMQAFLEKRKPTYAGA